VKRPIRAAILGASGYGAGELLRLLIAHPAVEVVSITSTSQAGAAIGEVHPHLRGFYDELRVTESVDFGSLLDAEHAVIFSALPHGASAAAIDGILSKQICDQQRSVDQSRDRRGATPASNHSRDRRGATPASNHSRDRKGATPASNQSRAHKGAFAKESAALSAQPLPDGRGSDQASRSREGAGLSDADAALQTSPKIIDLSGDFRLSDVALHERCYPETPALLERRAEFVYGLPEIIPRDRIRAARCISNPGCLASAAILAAAPLMDASFRGPIALDAKTGSSGSGRSLKEGTHHPIRHANFVAYRPLAHQHEPEILQAFGDPRGERIAASFVAQSMDAARGIFVTAHLTLAEPTDGAALGERYRRFYAASPFVRIVEGSPSLQDVVGSNFCDVAVAARGRQVIAMAALDNLVKGMAGTAIQNMNLMCGLEETTGLWFPSFRPV
jgi:N-acetyl-gamma-glutamyl-phosphate reductase